MSARCFTSRNGTRYWVNLQTINLYPESSPAQYFQQWKTDCLLTQFDDPTLKLVINFYRDGYWHYDQISFQMAEFYQLPFLVLRASDDIIDWDAVNDSKF